jgi:hypothetical protein
VIETALFGSPDGSGTRWRLLGAADAITSWHHVQLKFDITGGQLQGALVLRGTGEEIPLVDLSFDGTSLSLRLPGPGIGDGRLAKPPRLSLTLVDDREFRGYYVDESGARIQPAIQLKLIKVENE